MGKCDRHDLNQMITLNITNNGTKWTVSPLAAVYREGVYSFSYSVFRPAGLKRTLIMRK